MRAVQVGVGVILLAEGCGFCASMIIFVHKATAALAVLHNDSIVCRVPRAAGGARRAHVIFDALFLLDADKVLHACALEAFLVRLVRRAFALGIGASRCWRVAAHVLRDTAIPFDDARLFFPNLPPVAHMWAALVMVL